jgi:hypothetical protein
MATYFRTQVAKNLGTTPLDVIGTVDNNRFTVVGCNLANTIDEDVIVDVFVVDSSSTAAYYIKGLIIPPYTSAKVITNGEKLILEPNTFLRLVSDTADSVDAVVSYVEIV